MNIDVPVGVGAPHLTHDFLSPNSWHIVVHTQSALVYALKASVTADCDISHYALVSSLCKNLRIECLIACKGTTYAQKCWAQRHINQQTS